MAVKPVEAFSDNYVADLTRIAHKIERQIDTILGCDKNHNSFPILIDTKLIEGFNYHIFENMVRLLYLREGWAIGTNYGENGLFLLFSWFPPLQIATPQNKPKLGLLHGE